VVVSCLFFCNRL